MLKRLALILSLVPLLVLAACGGGNSNSGSSSSQSFASSGSGGQSAQQSTQKSEEQSGQQGEAQSEEYVIGVVNVNSIYSYYQAEIKGMEEQAKRENVKLVILDSQGDAGKEINNVESLISQQVDAILLITVGETVGGQSVQIANNAGVPIFAVSRSVAGAEPVSSIVTDASTAQAGADYFAGVMMGGKGKIAEIQGVQGDSNQILRAEALRNAMAQHPELELLESVIADYDPSKAYNAAADLLSKYPDLEAFYVHNDGMAAGVVQAVEAAGKIGQVKIFGIDGEPTAIASIREGKQTATAGVPIALEGARAVHAAVKHLKGETVEKKIVTPAVMIDASNVDQFPGSELWDRIDWPEYPLD